MARTNVDVVQVVLSAYNGELYLPALLESVLEQDHRSCRLLVRDDGSTDRTRELLSRCESLPGVRVIYGEHVGVVRSFFALLREVDPDVEFFALCDQDDVWKEDKLSRAVAELTPFTAAGTPALYCSDQVLVDEELRPLRVYGKVRPRPSFENALVQNIAPGCTMVFNRLAHQHIVKAFPRVVRMHDWWIYQVIAGVGEVVYDDHPTLLYRQQPANVVGGAATPFTRWSRRLRRFLRTRNRHIITQQARELLRIHGASLEPRKRAMLERFVSRKRSFGARIHYALTTELRRQTLLENLVLRLLILMDWV